MELRFLSGDSRGLSRQFASHDILVGDARACDLQLPPADSPSPDERQVRLRYAQAGWSLENLGTSLVAINHNVVSGTARLKSGDVIRLAPEGPDLLFTIVVGKPLPSTAASRPESAAAGAGPPSKPRPELVPSRPPGFAWRRLAWTLGAVALVALVGVGIWRIVGRGGESAEGWRPIPSQAVDEGQVWQLDVAPYFASRGETPRFRLAKDVPEGLELDEMSGVLHWTPTESQGPGSYPIEVEAVVANGEMPLRAACEIEVREVNRAPRIEPLSDRTFAVGSQDAFEVRVVASDPDVPAQPLEFRLGADAPTGMTVDHVTGILRWVPTAEQVGKTYGVEVLVSDPDTRSSPQRTMFRLTVLAPERKQQVESKVAAAIYLLALEEPASGTVFPFAVGLAVGNDRLLTSGYAVQELAQASDKGMAAVAINCVSRDVEDVQAFYVHPDFERLRERPESQIYVDAGLVQLPDKERPLAPLAEPDGPLRLEQGAPVHCVMPIYEAEPLTRFDDVRPTYNSAKIYMVTRQPDGEIGPETSRRLLHLVGTLPKNALGSPIVDDQGQVIAIYVEKADLSEDASLANLADRYHYALVLDSLMELLRGKLDTWRQLAPSPGPAGKKETP